MRETTPQRWIFEELKRLMDVDFKFKQKVPASEFTRKISAIMQTPLPREWLLSGYGRLVSSLRYLNSTLRPLQDLHRMDDDAEH